MTPAVANRLRRLARACVANGDYGALIAYVDAYAASPGEPRAAMPTQQPDGTLPMPTAADVARPLGSWQRWRRA